MGRSRQGSPLPPQKNRKKKIEEQICTVSQPCKRLTVQGGRPLPVHVVEQPGGGNDFAKSLSPWVDHKVQLGGVPESIVEHFGLRPPRTISFGPSGPGTVRGGLSP